MSERIYQLTTRQVRAYVNDSRVAGNGTPLRVLLINAEGLDGSDLTPEETDELNDLLRSNAPWLK